MQRSLRQHISAKEEWAAWTMATKTKTTSTKVRAEQQSNGFSSHKTITGTTVTGLWNMSTIGMGNEKTGKVMIGTWNEVHHARICTLT